MRVSCVVNEISATTVRVAVGAVVGGIAAAAVPALGVPVVTGAVFCGTTALVSKIVDATLGKLFNLSGTTALSHILGRVVTVLVAAGVAAAVATAIGFPITLMSGLAILGVILLAELIAYLACKLVSGAVHAIADRHEKRHHPIPV